jgi:hypothetical protein
VLSAAWPSAGPPGSEPGEGAGSESCRAARFASISAAVVCSTVNTFIGDGCPVGRNSVSVIFSPSPICGAVSASAVFSSTAVACTSTSRPWARSVTTGYGRFFVSRSRESAATTPLIESPGSSGVQRSPRNGVQS